MVRSTSRTTIPGNRARRGARRQHGPRPPAAGVSPAALVPCAARHAGWLGPLAAGETSWAGSQAAAVQLREAVAAVGADEQPGRSPSGRQVAGETARGRPVRGVAARAADGGTAVIPASKWR